MASGKVRVVITGFSQGSVVVTFAIVFVPSEGQDIMEVSKSLMTSLQNSSRYTVDSNSISIEGISPLHYYLFWLGTRVLRYH